MAQNTFLLFNFVTNEIKKLRIWHWNIRTICLHSRTNKRLSAI